MGVARKNVASSTAALLPSLPERSSVMGQPPVQIVLVLVLGVVERPVGRERVLVVYEAFFVLPPYPPICHARHTLCGDPANQGGPVAFGPTRQSHGNGDPADTRAFVWGDLIGNRASATSGMQKEREEQEEATKPTEKAVSRTRTNIDKGIGSTLSLGASAEDR